MGNSGKELVGTEYTFPTPEGKIGRLVLTRKVEEGILIGENIFVKILGEQRGRVKVGVKAPEDVKVLRGELLDESRGHRSKERF